MHSNHLPPKPVESETKLKFAPRQRASRRSWANKRALAYTGMIGLPVICSVLWATAKVPHQAGATASSIFIPAAANDSPTQPPAPPMADMWTEESVSTFGKMVAQVLGGENAKGAREMLDANAIARRIVGGLPLEGAEAEELLSNARALVCKDWEKVFGNAVGQPTKLLAVRSKGGFPSCLLRAFGADGQPIYTEVLLRPQGDSFRILDAFLFNSGLYASETLRPHILSPLAASYPKAVADLLKVDAAWLREGSPLMTILKAFERGEYVAILNAASSLPSTLREARGIRPFLATALVAEKDTHHFGSLQKGIWKKNPEDMGYGFLAYHSLVTRGELDLARRSLGLLQAEIGDAMLNVSEAQLCLSEARFEDASQLLDAVSQAEPELDLGVGLRLARVLGRQNFTAAVAVLDEFKKSGQQVTADDLGEPIFREFRRSREFSAWQNGGPVEAATAEL